MKNDSALLADILQASAKLLAQEAVQIRYRELGKEPVSNDCVGTINAAVRCLKLAEHYQGKTGD